MGFLSRVLVSAAQAALQTLLDQQDPGQAPAASNVLGSGAVPQVVSVNPAPVFLSALRSSVPADDSHAIRAGSLDSTFGRGGAVVLSASSGVVRAVAIDDKGAYVVAGQSSNDRGRPSITVARYTDSGHLDTSFGKSGCVRLDLAYPAEALNDSVATAVAVQIDGSIVIAGAAHQPPSAFSFEDLVLARLTRDGRLDPSFSGGWLRVPFGMASSANALIIEPDGRIVAAGYLRDPQSGRFHIFLLRVTADGFPDPSFGEGGFVLLPASSDEQAVSIARHAHDGKIVGAARQSARFDKKFAFFRLASNGSLDATFGDQGRVSLDVGGGDNILSSIVVQPDGKYVVAGYLESRQYVLLRLDSTGAVDPTFGDGGLVGGKFGGGSEAGAAGNSFGRALAVEPSGAIYLGGAMTGRSTQVGYAGGLPIMDADRACALARFLPDGELDASFAAAGVVLTDLGDGADEIHAIALVGDTVVAAGQSGRGMALLRFHANERQSIGDTTVVADGPTAPDVPEALEQEARDGAEPASPSRVEWLDPAFGDAGLVIDERLVNPCAFMLDHQGRLLVAGMEADAAGSPLRGVALARYHSDGRPDDAFGDRGVARAITPALCLPYALMAAPDGAWYVAAKPLEPSVVATLLARFDTGGKITVFELGLPEFDAQALTVDGEGRILLGGQLRQTFAVVRFELTAAPRLDASFAADGGTPGVALGAFGKDFSCARCLAPLPDGRLLAAGTADVGKGDNPLDFALVCFENDGALSRGFGKAGRCTVSLKGTDDTAHAMALQPDGNILLAGEAVGASGPPGVPLVLRISASGQAERGFNRGHAHFEGEVPGTARAITLDAAGGILIAGSALIEEDLRSASTGGAECVILRLTPAGELDTRWGDAGVIRVSEGPLGSQLLGVSASSRLGVVAMGKLPGRTSDPLLLARVRNPSGR